MKTVSAYRNFHQTIWPKPFVPRPHDWELVHRIRERASAREQANATELADQIAQLRTRVRSGESPLLREIFTESAALTYEAVRRTLGLEYYDVQLLAGIALASGSVAEMKTGEGKTIVAALPAVLHALAGDGVHVATVNAYLAERDFELLRPVYEILGLAVGLSREKADLPSKRQAYAADITYSTGYELGFDYLRDQAALRGNRKPILGTDFRMRLRGTVSGGRQTVQRGHAFAVIDEIDSVLIDEANTPLVLSSQPNGSAANATPYLRAAEVAALLEDGEHYILDRRRRTFTLTERGHTIVFQHQHSNFVDGLVRPWQIYVEQAIRAEQLLERDADYVVTDGEVRIVDQYTGRIFSDRTWRDGLHQAVEVKEQLNVTNEKSSLGRVSRQRYFGLYDRLCGMTGTATGHEREFQEFYGLPVVIIPERVPNQRQHLATRYFGSQTSKHVAIVTDIRQRNLRGQPVLVGTRTIDESQALVERLEEAQISFQLLNGLQNDDEAAIVEVAGQMNAVTIATNMAGRGTDIALGEGVDELGGLHVIATQRQESQRVDRQLVGRSARQGSPGSCQCFVAADDDLIQQFDASLGQRMATMANAEGEIRRELDKEVDRVQSQAEAQRYQQRADLFRQDEWLNEVLTTVAEKDSAPVAQQVS